MSLWNLSPFVKSSKIPAMKKNIIILLLTTILLPVFSQEENRTIEFLTSRLDETEKAILEEHSKVFRYGKERKGLYYTPDVSLADNIVERFNSLEPNVTVEALYRVPYPDDMLTGYDRDLILYNIVREVSNISGVQYYSTRKERLRVLFDDVYAMDEKKKPIDDPLVNSIPEYDSFPIHMKEANLGRDYYLAEYNYDGQDMSFSITNTSTMSFLLKVVGEEQMQIDLLLMPLDDEILIYGYCGVKLSNSGFVHRIMDPYSSFYRRLYAMEIWFSNSLHNEQKRPEDSLGNLVQD